MNEARVRARPRVLLGLVCAALVGCASTNQELTSEQPQSVMGDGTAEPASPAETKVLAQLEQLPPTQASTIDGLSVVADAPYAAASGKTCRRLTLTSVKPPKASRVRLACRNGDAWGFVPSVFLVPAEQ